MSVFLGTFSHSPPLVLCTPPWTPPTHPLTHGALIPHNRAAYITIHRPSLTAPSDPLLLSPFFLLTTVDHNYKRHSSTFLSPCLPSLLMAVARHYHHIVGSSCQEKIAHNHLSTIFFNCFNCGGTGVVMIHLADVLHILHDGNTLALL